MIARDVIELYTGLHAVGIVIWLDGGWGVDALLHVQTRSHADVDVIVQKKDVDELRIFFEEKGYTNVPRDDTSLWNFVLGDQRERLVDVHVIEFDTIGNGIYGPKEKGVMYPASSFTAIGKIEGISVQCLSAEYQIESHSGYALQQKDFQDVNALCEKFGIPLPKEYRSFR